MLEEIMFLMFIMWGTYFVAYKKGYEIYSIFLWSASNLLSMAILTGIARYIGLFGFLTTIILFVIWLKENNQKIFKGKIKI